MAARRIVTKISIRNTEMWAAGYVVYEIISRYFKGGKKREEKGGKGRKKNKKICLFRLFC